MKLLQKKAFASLSQKDFRIFLASLIFNTLASRTMVVVIAFQIYSLTHSAWALGFLGLVEALPCLSLSLFGGHVADRINRKKIMVLTLSVSVLSALLLAFFSLDVRWGATPFYGLVFLAGLARGFADPAASALEAQIVPREHMVNASTWASSAWLICSIVGPGSAGFLLNYAGGVLTYLLIASFFLMALICMTGIGSYDTAVGEKTQESVWQSIGQGLNYVFKHQVLWAPMALDLFAVFFGGATALFPIFALDILKVGASGLGFLAAAPAVGSLLSMLWAMHHPPKKNAGKILLACVTGFGISMIVFGLSRHFVLSLVALVFSGIFDGVSVVIRRAIVRLFSPDHLRGRIAAVSWIFIGSSNELGAFESGTIAGFVGAAACVWGGGIVTILVVLTIAKCVPSLVRLNLD